MYRHWKSDPKSVHVSWATYFEGLDKGVPSASAFQLPPGLSGSGAAAPAVSSSDMGMEGGGEVVDYLKVYLLLFW